MFHHKNFLRGHIKVGNSIIDVKKLKKNREKTPENRENREIEIKMKNISLGQKKIKPLNFKF
jgi:hypothetical protein